MSNFNDEDELDLDDSFEVLSMTDDNGESVDFIVIDGTKLNGVTYLLVVDSRYDDEEESEAVILKETSVDGKEAVYEPVSDDEFDAVAGLFQQSNDDFEIDVN